MHGTLTMRVLLAMKLLALLALAVVIVEAALTIAVTHGWVCP